MMHAVALLGERSIKARDSRVKPGATINPDCQRTTGWSTPQKAKRWSSIREWEIGSLVAEKLVRRTNCYVRSQQYPISRDDTGDRRIGLHEYTCLRSTSDARSCRRQVFLYRGHRLR